MSDKENQTGQELKFEENPYDPSRKKPEDVVRLFYQHNVPIIPVVSKRGTLMGILKKEDVIAELSDIERVEKLSIDAFITKLAARMPLDALLNYGKVREFIVINMFGEFQGRWSRLQLFAAAETNDKGASHAADGAESQKEEQVLEWMIYLILEHIPRALYALNEKNKTIFYNSYFEDLYREKFGSDVDASAAEKFFKDPRRNQLVSSDKEGEHNFYSDDLGVYYERIPMISNKKRVGFLIFCRARGEGAAAAAPVGGEKLMDVLDRTERQMIVDALNLSPKTSEAAASLGISIKQLQGKIKKHEIKK